MEREQETYLVAGELYSKDEMIEANKDDPDFLAWMDRPQIGDVYTDMHAETVKRVS